MYNNPIYPNNSLVMNPQQRMEQLVSQYPQYFNQNVQQAIGTQTGWRILQVSNIEEANATPADLTGSPLFFFNKATKEIYMKQLDQTGAVGAYVVPTTGDPYVILLTTPYCKCNA